MDEATSSLDTISEEFVQKTIARLITEKKTIIIIAHRLSTVKKANKIFVLEKGKVIEQGNHQELLNKNSKYKELWNKQGV